MVRLDTSCSCDPREIPRAELGPDVPLANNDCRDEGSGEGQEETISATEKLAELQALNAELHALNAELHASQTKQEIEAFRAELQSSQVQHDIKTLPETSLKQYACHMMRLWLVTKHSRTLHTAFVRFYSGGVVAAQASRADSKASEAQSALKSLRTTQQLLEETCANVNKGHASRTIFQIFSSAYARIAYAAWAQLCAACALDRGRLQYEQAHLDSVRVVLEKSTRQSRQLFGAHNILLWLRGIQRREVRVLWVRWRATSVASRSVDSISARRQAESAAAEAQSALEALHMDALRTNQLLIQERCISANRTHAARTIVNNFAWAYARILHVAWTRIFQASALHRARTANRAYACRALVNHFSWAYGRIFHAAWQKLCEAIVLHRVQLDSEKVHRDHESSQQQTNQTHALRMIVVSVRSICSRAMRSLWARWHAEVVASRRSGEVAARELAEAMAADAKSALQALRSKQKRTNREHACRTMLHTLSWAYCRVLHAAWKKLCSNVATDRNKARRGNQAQRVNQLQRDMEATAAEAKTTVQALHSKQRRTNREHACRTMLHTLSWPYHRMLHAAWKRFCINVTSQQRSQAQLDNRIQHDLTASLHLANQSHAVRMTCSWVRGIHVRVVRAFQMRWHAFVLAARSSDLVAARRQAEATTAETRTALEELRVQQKALKAQCLAANREAACKTMVHTLALMYSRTKRGVWTRLGGSSTRPRISSRLDLNYASSHSNQSHAARLMFACVRAMWMRWRALMIRSMWMRWRASVAAASTAETKSCSQVETSASTGVLATAESSRQTMNQSHGAHIIYLWLRGINNRAIYAMWTRWYAAVATSRLHGQSEVLSAEAQSALELCRKKEMLLDEQRMAAGREHAYRVIAHTLSWIRKLALRNGWKRLSVNTVSALDGEREIAELSRADPVEDTQSREFASRQAKAHGAHIIMLCVYNLYQRATRIAWMRWWRAVGRTESEISRLDSIQGILDLTRDNEKHLHGAHMIYLWVVGVQRRAVRVAWIRWRAFLLVSSSHTDVLGTPDTDSTLEVLRMEQKVLKARCADSNRTHACRTLVFIFSWAYGRVVHAAWTKLYAATRPDYALLKYEAAEVAEKDARLKYEMMQVAGSPRNMHEAKDHGAHILCLSIHRIHERAYRIAWVRWCFVTSEYRHYHISAACKRAEIDAAQARAELELLKEQQEAQRELICAQQSKAAARSALRIIRVWLFGIHGRTLGGAWAKLCIALAGMPRPADFVAAQRPVESAIVREKSNEGESASRFLRQQIEAFNASQEVLQREWSSALHAMWAKSSVDHERVKADVVAAQETLSSMNAANATLQNDWDTLTEERKSRALRFMLGGSRDRSIRCAWATLKAAASEYNRRLLKDAKKAFKQAGEEKKQTEEDQTQDARQRFLTFWCDGVRARKVRLRTGWTKLRSVALENQRQIGAHATRQMVAMQRRLSAATVSTNAQLDRARSNHEELQLRYADQAQKRQQYALRIWLVVVPQLRSKYSAWMKLRGIVVKRVSHEVQLNGSPRRQLMQSQRLRLLSHSPSSRHLDDEPVSPTDSNASYQPSLTGSITARDSSPRRVVARSSSQSTTSDGGAREEKSPHTPKFTEPEPLAKSYPIKSATPKSTSPKTPAQRHWLTAKVATAASKFSSPRPRSSPPQPPARQRVPPAPKPLFEGRRIVRLYDVFNNYDSNANGTLEPIELQAALEEMNFDPSDDMIESLLVKFGKMKGDERTICFESFQKMVSELETDSNRVRFSMTAIAAPTKSGRFAPTTRKRA